MPTEDAFLAAITANPADDLPRLVYADWLDERDDPRGAFVRLHAELRKLGPDHVHRVPGEVELSRLRLGCEVEWLAVMEPEGSHLLEGMDFRRSVCKCFEPGYDRSLKWSPLGLHTEPQDTESRPWRLLCRLIDDAIADDRPVLTFNRFIPLEDYPFLVTLPPTIAKLKKVRRIDLTGSHVLRIPPEIGEMGSLESFDTYMSYRLHWYPYEIVRRGPMLRESMMSTRALYGNPKLQPPFPSLVNPDEPHALNLPGLVSPVRPCSVCTRPFEDFRKHRVWISLRVATDVMPLLVNACSRECVLSLPSPPDGYHPKPHRGGLGTPQTYR